MKSHTEELLLNVPERRAIVSLHRDVERLVAESGIKDGLCLVNTMHITASVFINDDESGLHAAYDRWLEKLVPFEGEHYQFTLCPPAFTLGPIDVPFPKVFLAAVNPAMTRVAGRVADGLLPHSFTTEKYVREVTLPNLARGAEQAGKDVTEIKVAAGGIMALAETEDELERKLLELRTRVAFYGSTRTYQKVFEIHEQEELGRKLHELSVQNRWDDMPGVVPLEVVQEFVTSGTFDSLPGEIEKRQGFADRVSIDVSTRSNDEQNDERLMDLIRRVQSIQGRAS